MSASSYHSCAEACSEHQEDFDHSSNGTASKWGPAKGHPWLWGTQGRLQGDSAVRLHWRPLV